MYVRNYFCFGVLVELLFTQPSVELTILVPCVSALRKEIYIH